VPAFAVLRIAKITSLAGLAGASAHNARTADAGLDHATDHAPQMGGGVQLLAGSEDAVAAWRERCERLGIDPAGIRKDGVRAVELVMSASPEWFAAASDEDRAAWRDRSLAWASELVGRDNVLQATLHDDEDTPHLHLLAIPATLKERRKAGRPRRGRSPATAAPAPSWGLSAADLVGTREQLVGHQTAYAAELADLGIRRGIPRRVTGTRHQSAHAYRAAAAADREAAAESREVSAWMAESTVRTAAEDGRLMLADAAATATARGVELVDQARSSAAAILSRAERQAEAFTAGLDAIDAGELIHRPASRERAQGLERRPVELPVLPTDPERLRSWREAVAPLWGRLVGYAGRLAGLQAREQVLDRVAARQAAAERAQGVQAGPAAQDALLIAQTRPRRSQRPQDER
jgi:hypothetical protein